MAAVYLLDLNTPPLEMLLPIVPIVSRIGSFSLMELKIPTEAVDSSFSETSGILSLLPWDRSFIPCLSSSSYNERACSMALNSTRHVKTVAKPSTEPLVVLTDSMS